MAIAKHTPGKKVPAFQVESFLKGAAQRAQYKKGSTIFSQGDLGIDVRFIESGTVKLSVMSKAGKEAVVAMLGTGDFFGEGVIAGQVRRVGKATAMSACNVLVIDKEIMIRLLHEETSFCDKFIAYVLARNARVEADLVDHVFNSSEKRLARALLLLAHYGGDSPTQTIPRISQETLAEMIGATRSRVNLFMNKFRKLGLIEYNGTLKVNSALLSIVLHD